MAQREEKRNTAKDGNFIPSVRGHYEFMKAKKRKGFHHSLSKTKQKKKSKIKKLKKLKNQKLKN